MFLQILFQLSNKSQEHRRCGLWLLGAAGLGPSPVARPPKALHALAAVRAGSQMVREPGKTPGPALPGQSVHMQLFQG